MLLLVGVEYEKRRRSIPLNSRRYGPCVKARGCYLTFESIKIHTATQSDATFR